MNLILASSWSITASPRLMFADRNEGGVDNCDEIIMSHFLPHEPEPCLFSLKWWRSGFGTTLVSFPRFSRHVDLLNSIETTLIKVTTEMLSALDCFVLLLVHLLFLLLTPKTKKNIQSKLSAMRDKNCTAARVSNDAWTKPCSMIRR